MTKFDWIKKSRNKRARGVPKVIIMYLIFTVYFFIPDKNGRVNCFRSFGYKKERVRKYPFLPFTTGCFVGWLEVICAS